MSYSSTFNFVNLDKSMRKVEAIIRHHRLDDVKQALAKRGVQGMTIAEVRGFGSEQGNIESYRGVEYEVDFMPRLKLEVIVADGDCDDVVKTIISAARTGEVGDGRILISRLEEVVRVRTGESGEDAI